GGRGGPRRAVPPGARIRRAGGGTVTETNDVRETARLDVDALLDSPRTRIVVCCGAGGVGKTTTAAALGLRAAERGRRTVVITVDPARRLAQSMGLAELDNTPRPVPLPETARGSLHA